MKKLFLILVVLILTMACRGSFDIGEQVEATQIPKLTQSQSLPPTEPPAQEPQKPPPTEPPAQEPQKPPPTEPLAQPPTQRPEQTSQVTFTPTKDISCSEGPDWTKYWFVAPVRAYQTVTLIGRNKSGDYGVTEKGCWVWLEKGNVQGNVLVLPIFATPSLPIVEIRIENGFNVPVYFRFYDWYTDERIEGLAFLLDPGKIVKVRLPSNYYAILGYNNNNLIYQSPMLNLAVGDGDHVQKLKTSAPLFVLKP